MRSSGLLAARRSLGGPRCSRFRSASPPALALSALEVTEPGTVVSVLAAITAAGALVSRGSRGGDLRSRRRCWRSSRSTSSCSHLDGDELARRRSGRGPRTVGASTGSTTSSRRCCSCPGLLGAELLGSDASCRCRGARPRHRRRELRRCGWRWRARVPGRVPLPVAAAAGRAADAARTWLSRAQPSSCSGSSSSAWTPPRRGEPRDQVDRRAGRLNSRGHRRPARRLCRGSRVHLALGARDRRLDSGLRLGRAAPSALCRPRRGPGRASPSRCSSTTRRGTSRASAPSPRWPCASGQDVRRVLSRLASMRRAVLIVVFRAPPGRLRRRGDRLADRAGGGHAAHGGRRESCGREDVSSDARAAAAATRSRRRRTSGTTGPNLDEALKGKDAGLHPGVDRRPEREDRVRLPAGHHAAGLRLAARVAAGRRPRRLPPADRVIDLRAARAEPGRVPGGSRAQGRGRGFRPAARGGRPLARARSRRWTSCAAGRRSRASRRRSRSRS